MMITYRDEGGNVVTEEHEEISYETDHWYWDDPDGDGEVRVQIPRDRVIRVERPQSTGSSNPVISSLARNPH
jgi:hypothetical protein